MAQRKISIMDHAAEEVAFIAYFIESKGLPKTARKFIDDSFVFFDKLGDIRIKHKPCAHEIWKHHRYRCASFRKKYVIAYLDKEDEIIICDFVSYKLLF